jgi:GT2 family glycosyltransferase
VSSGVAVVIVNYNGENLLADCLAALAAQTVAPAEIVVADNGSRDGSLALVRSAHPGVRALELGRNHGFGGGANRGVRATAAPWVCVLNSDATPAPDWLASLTAASVERQVWSLGSVLVSAATGLIESAGDAYAPDGYAYKLLRDRPVADLPDAPFRVFAAPGAAPVFRRRVFDLLGGYEERFFLYYEDVDLAFRAALAGYHALVVPSARVTHRLGATTRSMARLRFYVARNSTWCAARCLPDASLPRLARRALAELRVNRPRRYAAAEVAGRVAGLAGLPRALRERRAIQARRVATSAQIAALLGPPEP